MLAGLTACGGSGSSATGDPGAGGGSGDGSGGGSGAATLIHIGDVAGDEADSGTTVLTFVVSLSQPREIPIAVAYATEDGSAKSTGADADFQAKSGMLLFEPGATALEVRIFVNGDQEIEPNETFLVKLGEPEVDGVALGDAAGQGLIRNEDAYEVSVHDVETPEGDFSAYWLDFPIRLSTPSESLITVQYVTQNTNGSGAEPMGDYTWRRGTAIFEPGQLETTVSIRVLGDFVSEEKERFAIELFDPTGFDVVVEDERALARILDDDTPLQLDDDAGPANGLEPVIATSGELLGTLWLDDRQGQRGVWFERSTDAGWSWSGQAVRVDHAPPGSPVSHASLAIDGQNAYAVWQDGRNGKADVFFNHSTDGGLTWQASDLRLDTDAPGDAASVEPELVVQGSRVYVIWEDFRGGTSQVRFNRSVDGGATWEANDVRISDPVGVNAPAYHASMAASGDRVYIAWADRRNGAADIYMDLSTDAGLTWRATDLLVEHERPGEDTSEHPQVACDGEAVYVVWEDEREGERDIYFNRSVDGGDYWNSEDRRLEDAPAGVYASRRPRIACDGFKLVVVWEDDRGGLPDVYSTSSPDAGFTWRPNLRLSRGGPAGFSSSTEPELAFNGQNVIVTWLDDRDGQLDVYMNRSQNHGENFHQTPLRVDGAGDRDSREPRIVAEGDRFQVVWREDGPTSEVMFRSIEFP